MNGIGASLHTYGVGIRSGNSVVGTSASDLGLSIVNSSLTTNGNGIAVEESGILAFVNISGGSISNNVFCFSSVQLLQTTLVV